MVTGLAPAGVTLGTPGAGGTSAGAPGLAGVSAAIAP
jgi:hypothetical protein